MHKIGFIINLDLIVCWSFLLFFLLHKLNYYNLLGDFSYVVKSCLQCIKYSTQCIWNATLCVEFVSLTYYLFFLETLIFIHSIAVCRHAKKCLNSFILIQIFDQLGWCGKLQSRPNECFTVESSNSTFKNEKSNLFTFIMFIHVPLNSWNFMWKVSCDSNIKPQNLTKKKLNFDSEFEQKAIEWQVVK